ncbi:MAG: hypothetical protein V4633_20030 [Pseudomonadota bacterium]
MATDDDSSHAIIERFLASERLGAVDLSVQLAQLLAGALAGIIGEIGFQSILLRSVVRTARAVPWLTYDARSYASDPEFEHLRQCLTGQEPAAVLAATRQLFKTFIDILVSLIGEHLTLVILRTAVSHAMTGNTPKEQHNG